MRWAIITPEYDYQIASTGYCALRPDESLILTNFLAHLLGTSNFYHYIKTNQTEGNYPSIPDQKIRDYQIPLLPLNVQRQIIDILDDFKDLESNLQRDLELRLAQFEFALDEVFGDLTYPTKTLGDLGSFTKGKGITKAQLVDSGIPAMHYGQVHTSYGHTADSTISFVDESLVKKPSIAQTGDIVLATTSEDDDAVGKAVAWLGNEDVIVGGDAYVYSHSLEPRYASYFFASHSFQRQKQTKLTGAKVRRINDTGLASLSIPVPPVDEQSKIADHIEMIDRYMQGIEREIELRKDQLEYYRDQLLTFPTK